MASTFDTVRPRRRRLARPRRLRLDDDTANDDHFDDDDEHDDNDDDRADHDHDGDGGLSKLVAEARRRPSEIHPGSGI